MVFLIWGACPPSSLSFVVSGQVVDVRTGVGIDGLWVGLGAAADTTNLGGCFRLEFSGSGRFVVDGTAQGYSVYLLERMGVSSDTMMMVRLIPLGPLRSGYYRNLLHFFRLLTGTGEPSRRAQEDVSISYESSPRTTILKRWESLPVRVHVPRRASGGVSWDAVIRQAVENWEEKVGIDLFDLVDDPSRAQVGVVYRGGYSRVVFEEAGPGGVPRKATLWLSRTLQRPEDVLSSAEHELGHVLMLLVHSEDSGHLMFWGGSRGRRVSADEALLVRCLYGLPNLTDMSTYREEVPPSQRSVERKRVLAVVLVQVLLALFAILSAH